MNATRWLTLGNFIKYLGREGLVVVEDTPKGFYITYIDRDPAKAQREAEKAKNEANDLDASERYTFEISGGVPLPFCSEAVCITYPCALKGPPKATSRHRQQATITSAHAS